MHRHGTFAPIGVLLFRSHRLPFGDLAQLCFIVYCSLIFFFCAVASLAVEKQRTVTGRFSAARSINQSQCFLSHKSFVIIVPDDHAILESFMYDTVNYFGWEDIHAIQLQKKP
jgi:hypothetical protein